jgi:hypothetical protein
MKYMTTGQYKNSTAHELMTGATGANRHHRTHDEADVELTAAIVADETVQGTINERHVVVVDAVVAAWPGVEGMADDEKLANVLADLSRWSDWGVKQPELNTKGVNYQEKETDFISAWQAARRHYSGDVEESFNDDMPYLRSDVGSMGATGTVELPRITSRSKLFDNRDGIHRGHEGLSRWNLSREVRPLDVNSLADALADTMHWADAKDVDWQDAFKRAIDIAEPAE